LHIVPTLGRVALRKLSPPQVQDLLRAKAAAGLSPRTVRYILLVLRIALGKGVKWSLVTRNVAALVDAPRVPHRATFFLGPDEARRFLEVTADDRLAALYTVALSLGLRRGEALGLRWSDIDLEAGRLTVSAALQRIKGQGPQLVETKTARSRRTIPLPAMSIAALRQHYVRQLEERAVAGSRWVEPASSSPHVMEARWTVTTSRETFSAWLSDAACLASGSMIFDTAQQACCLLKVSRRESSWMFSGTPRSA
jgi:integrase